MKYTRSYTGGEDPIYGMLDDASYVIRQNEDKEGNKRFKHVDNCIDKNGVQRDTWEDKDGNHFEIWSKKKLLNE